MTNQKLEELRDAVCEGIWGDDRMSRNDMDDALEALTILCEEIERLESENDTLRVEKLTACAEVEQLQGTIDMVNSKLDELISKFQG